MARLPKTAAGFVEQQSDRLLQKALGQLDKVVGQATAAVNDRKRRKYILAGLAALALAGKASERVYAQLRSSPTKAAPRAKRATKRAAQRRKRR